MARGVMESMGWLYYSGLAVSLGFVIYQHKLLATGEPTLAFVAFLNNNWLTLVIFIGIAADFWLRHAY